MITAEQLPDGSTVYTFSGYAPLKPFVFEGSDLGELVDFAMNHCRDQTKEWFDQHFPDPGE